MKPVLILCFCYVIQAVCLLGIAIGLCLIFTTIFM